MSECVITYDSVATYAVSIMEFTDLVTHETSTFGGLFQSPPCRAALAEPILGRDR